MKTMRVGILSICVVVFILAAVAPVVAQSTFFSRTNSGLIDDYVTRITLFRGLPVFGTEGGISILQGDRFENWRRGDQGFPDAPVRGVAVLGDRLWVGTYGKGLARLEDGRWRSFTQADSGLGDDFVTALLAHGNRLFVGTRAGLAAYDGLLWRPIKLDADRPVMVTALAPDRTGVLVGTNLGVFRLDEGLQPVVIDLGVDSIPWIQSLDVAGGIYYLGFDGGLLAIANDGRRRFWSGSQLPSPRILDVIALEDGALLATGRGLARVFLNGAVTMLDVSQVRLLNGVSASALLRGSGAWWVGFAGAGLLRLADLTGFSTFQSNADRNAILGNPSPNAGTPNAGLAGVQGFPGTSVLGGGFTVPTGLNQANNGNSLGFSAIGPAPTSAPVVQLDRAQQGGSGLLAAIPGANPQTPFTPAQQVAPQPLSFAGNPGNQGSAIMPAPVSGSVPGNVPGPAVGSPLSPVQIERPADMNSGNGVGAVGNPDRLELPGNIRAVLEEGDVLWAASLDGLYRWRAGEQPRRIGPAMPCQALAAANGRVYAAFETGEILVAAGDQFQTLAMRGLPPAPLSLAVIGETLAIGTDLGLFAGPISGGGEAKPFASMKGKRVAMMQAADTLLWMATDDGLYKFDFARSFSERVSETTISMSALRVTASGIFTADRQGLVIRFNTQRQVESWSLKNVGRINGFMSTESGETMVAAENGVFSVTSGRQDISRLETIGAQGFFRRSGKIWIIRKNRAELYRPGTAEPVPAGNAGSISPVAQGQVSPALAPSSAPSGSDRGAFKVSSVQVFPPPTGSEGQGAGRMGDVGAPLLVPPTGTGGSEPVRTPAPETQLVQTGVQGNDPTPAWANYRRPPKPKNLGFFKDVLPMMGRSCLSCHTSGAGRYFPLNDPKTVIAYFKQAGADRFMQFLEPGGGMYGVVSPTDAELLQIWVKEGSKE